MGEIKIFWDKQKFQFYIGIFGRIEIPKEQTDIPISFIGIFSRQKEIQLEQILILMQFFWEFFSTETIFGQQ